jgi:hypothetical protein
MFPFCTMCRLKLQKTKMTRRCSGALVYDAAMRPGRIECENDTGDLQANLCASCRVQEKLSRNKGKQLQDKCPTCGQNTSGARAARAAPQQNGSGYQQNGYQDRTRGPSSSYQGQGYRSSPRPSPSSYPERASSPPTSRSGPVTRPYPPQESDED